MTKSVSFPSGRYRFGEFVIDTTTYSIAQAGRDLTFQPKVFDLLCYLIVHRDRVVTKDELLSALWHEQYVDEFAVPWTVSHARRLIGQRKGEQRPIRTVHGRGYRFVADVVELGPDQPETAQTFPEPLAPPPEPFVGRDNFMQLLAGYLTRAKQGHGSCCLLVGSAGIGKTRLLDELCARAAANGFAVWTGRSVEATCGPVFWPWIQILRALVTAHTGLAETGNAVIARLLAGHEQVEAAPAPSLRARASEEPTESDRFWQYDAIATLLQEAARERPLMLSFDDLHWADAGTCELLSFLAPEMRRWPILIVGAKREDERAVSRDPHAQLAREIERVELTALDAIHIEQYLRALGVADPSRALCRAVQVVSLGNPWFVRETLQRLITRHGLSALASLDASAVEPARTALEFVRNRFTGLDPDTRLVLGIASVMGERFEIDVVVRMSGLTLDRVLVALESGRRQGMIALEPPQHARFSHSLLRSVLYEDLPLPERLHLHAQAAWALEETLDPLRYGEIAHHYHCALPLQAYGRAALAAVRAADAAFRSHAFADAARFLEWATAAQANDVQVPPRERVELLLQRAYAERFCGREGQARTNAANAIDLAHEHGYHDLSVRAVRVLRISYALATMPDPLALAALEETLRKCPEGACEQRVSALSLLSWIPPHALDMERSKALSAQAVALADELRTPSARREALHARLYALSGPDDIDALLATAEALLAVPGERPFWFGLEPLLASYRAHLYRCDLAAADATLAAVGRAASEQSLAEGAWLHDLFQAQRVFFTGDFQSAEALFTDLAARGARLRLAYAPILDGVARSLLTYDRAGIPALRQDQGFEGMLTMLLAFPASFAATGARLLAELGRLEPARQVLHRLSQQSFAAVVKDLSYVNTLANLSVVAIALGERAHAQAIYEQLAPYPHHNTPNGVIGFFEGSASRFLAGLAAFLGEPAQAKRHFDDALALNERLGALPQVARTCFEYARWLSQRDEPLAEALRLRAVGIAQRLGMRDLEACASAL